MAGRRSRPPPTSDTIRPPSRWPCGAPPLVMYSHSTLHDTLSHSSTPTLNTPHSPTLPLSHTTSHTTRITSLPSIPHITSSSLTGTHPPIINGSLSLCNGSGLFTMA